MASYYPFGIFKLFLSFLFWPLYWLSSFDNTMVSMYANLCSFYIFICCMWLLFITYKYIIRFAHSRFDSNILRLIRVITKLPKFEQSYKGKVKTHNYINKQNQSTIEMFRFEANVITNVQQPLPRWTLWWIYRTLLELNYVLIVLVWKLKKMKQT
jgi:hypothetical protein